MNWPARAQVVGRGSEWTAQAPADRVGCTLLVFFIFRG